MKKMNKSQKKEAEKIEGKDKYFIRFALRSPYKCSLSPFMGMCIRIKAAFEVYSWKKGTVAFHCTVICAIWT